MVGMWDYEGLLCMVLESKIGIGYLEVLDFRKKNRKEIFGKNNCVRGEWLVLVL